MSDFSDTPTPTPAPTAPAWPQLAAQLAGDATTTAELIQLLESERQCLAERDYQRFQQLLENKRMLLAALENGQRQRLAWLQRSGFTNESAALQAATSAAPEVAAQWRELASAWQQCQDLNQGNEQIAQRTRLLVGRVLDMLRGSGGESTLYDASGRARASGPGQPIGDA